MGELIFAIIVGVLGMLMGIKLGIAHLAEDLLHQLRLKPEEYSYINSWEYFKKCFKLFDDDNE